MRQWGGGTKWSSRCLDTWWVIIDDSPSLWMVIAILPDSSWQMLQTHSGHIEHSHCIEEILCRWVRWPGNEKVTRCDQQLTPLYSSARCHGLCTFANKHLHCDISLSERSSFSRRWQLTQHSFLMSEWNLIPDVCFPCLCSVEVYPHDQPRAQDGISKWQRSATWQLLILANNRRTLRVRYVLIVASYTDFENTLSVREDIATK